MLANRLLLKAFEDRGADPSWALPLTGEELDALAEHWQGGSVRVLARLVEGVRTPETWRKLSTNTEEETIMRR